MALRAGSVSIHGGFAAAIGGGQPAAPAQLVGIEHEFQVFAGDRQVDFRALIKTLRIDGRRLDPYDMYAHRCTWGGNITADDLEAEVSIPPVGISAGFAAHVDHLAGCAQGELRRVLPAGLRLQGFSTHLSISVPDELADRVCRLFAATFAADLILLTDRQVSDGLLLHPRRGRLELGVEFVEGRQLQAAIAFAAGATLAVVAAVRGNRVVELPPAVRATIVPATRRFGWYVDRNGFGPDLVDGGRAVALELASGEVMSAGEHLLAAWDVARAQLRGLVAPTDLVAADAVVGGTMPLPLERLLPGSRRSSRVPPVGPRSSFGDIVVPRVRPGFSAAPDLVTWDFAIVRFSHAERRIYAAIPARCQEMFLQALDAGDLDDIVLGSLQGNGVQPWLDGWRSALEPGLYRAIADRTEFIPPERGPDGRPWISDRVSDRVPGRDQVSNPAEGVVSRAPQSSAAPRPGKTAVVGPVPPAMPRQPGTIPTWLIGVVLVVIVVLVGGGVLVLGSSHVPGPTAATSAPLAAASPSPTALPCAGSSGPCASTGPSLPPEASPSTAPVPPSPSPVISGAPSLGLPSAAPPTTPVVTAAPASPSPPGIPMIDGGLDVCTLIGQQAADALFGVSSTLAAYPYECVITPARVVKIGKLTYVQVVVTGNPGVARQPSDPAFASKDGYGIVASANASGPSGAATKASYESFMRQWVAAAVATLP